MSIFGTLQPAGTVTPGGVDIVAVGVATDVMVEMEAGLVDEVPALVDQVLALDELAPELVSGADGEEIQPRS